MRLPRRMAAALTAVLLLGSGCSGPSNDGGSRQSGAAPRIQLSPPDDRTGPRIVEVVGLPPGDLSGLRAMTLTADDWNALLRVSVDGGAEDTRDLPPMLGTYSVSGDAIRFRPLFAFDAGRAYRAVFDPSRLPRQGSAPNEPWRSGPIEATLSEPAAAIQPTTRVARVYPSGDVIPENQLRLYIYFSAPMGLVGGTDHVHLLDPAGHTIEGAFLRLDVGLWNADRTRYTLLFDPGRVKRGILPNEQMGRPLVTGVGYTLVIDREWRDANGIPLAEPFTRRFGVGAPIEEAIDPTQWRVATPIAGTRDPLVVWFPVPLDYALLQRALVVATDRGDRIRGEIDVEAEETRWKFTPREPWRAGDYRLMALAVLEDPSGNRVDRPFEVRTEDAANHRRAPDTSVPFTVRPRYR